MELYLQPADSFMKSAGLFDNITSWFGGGNKPAAPQSAAPVNRNVGGVVNPGVESLEPYNVAPTNQQVDMSKIQELAKNYHTLSQYINSLTKEYQAYKDTLNPLYTLFNQMRPAWQSFRQRVYSDPQFAAQINQTDLSNAIQSMGRVLPMIGQMMTEQKKDQVQATQILQNAQPAFQAIAKLVGANISAAPVTPAATAPAAPPAASTPPTAAPPTAAPPTAAPPTAAPSTPAPSEPASAAPTPVASESVPGAPAESAPVAPTPPATRGRFQKGNVPHNKGKRRITTPPPGAPMATTSVAKVIQLFPKQGSSYSYVPNFKLVEYN